MLAAAGGRSAICDVLIAAGAQLNAYDSVRSFSLDFMSQNCSISAETLDSFDTRFILGQH